MLAPTEAFGRVEKVLVHDLELFAADELSVVRERHQRYERFREEHPERGWPAFSAVVFADALFPRLGASDFARAWAAWHGREFSGLRPLYEEIGSEFSMTFFDPLPLREPIAEGLPLGETLVKLGALRAVDVERGLALQREIEEIAGIRLFLGTILVGCALVMVGPYYQALAIHYGVPFEGIDEDAIERIQGAFLEKRQGRS